MKSKLIYIIFLSTLLLSVSCKNSKLSQTYNSFTKSDVDEIKNYVENETSSQSSGKIDVKFSLGKSVEYNNNVVEDTEELKLSGKEHSVKYYSYMPETIPNGENIYPYFDVGMNQRYLIHNKSLKQNNYEWTSDEGVMSKTPPKNSKMSYGIDISKHNGKMDFKKVKEAGFEFAFIRIAYRGYGKAGNLKEDEMYKVNLKNAKEAGLKIGAYVFSQALNEEEAIDEAKFAVNLLKGYSLDLPLVFDPETIKGDIARTDNIDGLQFTKNAIAFCEEVKKSGYRPAIYSNLVWEDYYYDLSKLQDYEIWYADYSKIPQTPYDFNYWQFSEVGIVDGIDGMVDLNVMIERE